ncbi:MAG: DNA-binding protein [Euryarchaeota archaeon]|nr:DNA-binding protein [Euryarchaeota archaeon]
MATDEEEIEALRRKRLQELQQQQATAELIRQEQLRQQIELQKRAILRQILTPDARARLTNIKMVKPEFAEQLELQLIQLAQTGQLKSQINDEQLKELLRKIEGRKKEIKIRRV